LPETPVEKPAGRERAPLLVAIETEWRTILWGIVYCLGAGPVFYILFVYVVSFLETMLHVQSRVALDINTASMVGLILFLVAGGVLPVRPKARLVRPMRPSRERAARRPPPDGVVTLATTL
jgi:hypothetical protein